MSWDKEADEAERIKRRPIVAELAKVDLEDVDEVDVYEVRRGIAGILSESAVDAVTDDPSSVYWRAGDRYFLDNPFRLEVLEITTELEFENGGRGFYYREG